MKKVAHELGDARSLTLWKIINGSDNVFLACDAEGTSP